jgi:peptidoglycan/xylan/chitin deacetylase (PgdA/CDA1 family)
MAIPILMYHQIDSPPVRGTPLRGLVVHPKDFSKQMRWLKWTGYQGLSMRDLEPYLAGKKQGRVFGITLDDGYKNNFDNALPVLIQHGFTATCYGVSSQIGGTNAWDTGLVAEKPLMGIREWDGWLQSGMEIGGHTRSHADLTALPPSAAREEIDGCKSDFERALDCEVRHFCYPFGRFAPQHADMVRESGYQTATTTRRGRVHANSEAMQLPRVMVARATYLLQLFVKMASAYEDKRA